MCSLSCAAEVELQPGPYHISVIGSSLYFLGARKWNSDKMCLVFNRLQGGKYYVGLELTTTNATLTPMYPKTSSDNTILEILDTKLYSG